MHFVFHLPHLKSEPVPTPLLSEAHEISDDHGQVHLDIGAHSRPEERSAATSSQRCSYGGRRSRAVDDNRWNIHQRQQRRNEELSTAARNMIIN